MDGGFAQGGSPHDLHANVAQCRPMPHHPKKHNEINDWHRGANPVPVSATPPLRSSCPNPLFYRAWRAGHQHPRRFLAEQDDTPRTLRCGMKSPEIAKTQ